MNIKLINAAHTHRHTHIRSANFGYVPVYSRCDEAYFKVINESILYG